MVTLYEKLNRKEMGVFLDALRSLKGSHIDPTSTPPSLDPEDWTEIPAKASEDFPKQCIAVVQGGTLLFRNNFTREGFRVNILPRGRESHQERIRTPEYGVDFDDDNLVLVCKVKYGDKDKEKSPIKLRNGKAIIRRIGLIKKTVFDPMIDKYGGSFADSVDEWFLDQAISSKISRGDLRALSKIISDVSWLVYLYNDGEDEKKIMGYIERNFGRHIDSIKKLQNAVKRYGVPETVAKLVNSCLDFVDSL